MNYSSSIVMTPRTIPLPLVARPLAVFLLLLLTSLLFLSLSHFARNHAAADADTTTTFEARGGTGTGTGPCGLNLLVYNNTALVGPPTVNRTITTADVVDGGGCTSGGLNFSLPGDLPISSEVIGTMTLLPPPSRSCDGEGGRGKVTGSYRFSCDFGIATVGFLFVDDHMVCQTGAFTSPGQVTQVDNPLRPLNRGEWPIRLEMWYVPVIGEGMGEVDGMRYGDSPELRIRVAVEYIPDPPEETTGGTARRYSLSPHLPPPEMDRRKLQRGMLASGGWGPWNHHTLLDQVHLPSGVRITTAICTIKSSSAAEGWGSTVDGHSELDDCVDVASPDDNARAGPLALDRTYGQFHVFNSTVENKAEGGVGDDGGARGCGGRGEDRSSSWNVSITFSGGPDLDMIVELDDYSLADADADVDGCGRGTEGEWHNSDPPSSPRLAVVISGGPLWHRAADVTISPPANGTSASMTLSPWGLDELKVYATATGVFEGATSDEVYADGGAAVGGEGASQSPRRLSSEGSAGRPDLPRIVLPLARGGKVVLSTRPGRSAEAIMSDLEEKRAREVERYRHRYGGHSRGEGDPHLHDVASAVQAGVAWNVIYVPTEAGPVVPVSRGWNGHLCHGFTDPEWCYILFEWDNVFASYILSTLGGGDAVAAGGEGGDVDVDVARDLAYSNLIQIVKSKTSRGFVPNYASGTDKSTDRTEPPVGATVLLEMYRKYGDKWLVELLIDDLLDWNDWFFSDRVLPPLNLICLGGTSMYNARLESGLDNSPMYDGEDYFDADTSQMLQYDVGFSSLVAAEATALAELADVVGRVNVATMLRERGRSLGRLVTQHLWDEELGIFVNKFSVNGTFHRRVSPTSFYPLLLGGDAFFDDADNAVAPSDARVDTMMNGWLFNSSRFCLTARGDFDGNSDDCYWGMPSISADDPAYLKGWVYWRGFVWGPMVQIVYWALRDRDHVPSARMARLALCRQMATMMTRQWVENGHICENYGSRKDRPDCTGNKFYHWGGLAGLISLLEYEVPVNVNDVW